MSFLFSLDVKGSNSIDVEDTVSNMGNTFYFNKF